MRAIIRKMFIGLGLLAAITCQLQQAKAQSLLSFAGHSEVIASGNDKTAPASTNSAAAVAPSKAEKRGRIELSISTASSENGITGKVEDKLTGVKITFESKRVGESLSSKINNADGFTLI